MSSRRRELPVPAYRAGASPLHRARAASTASLCLALALVCMLFDGPVAMAAVIAAVVAAGAAAGVGREIWRAALLSLPLVLLVTLVNPLVSREGDTLLVRGAEVLGRRLDVTLEALVAGGLAGLRIAALVMVFGLFSACVDPDALLRMLRRLSYRSALTGGLATRLVPVLARDALRMSDAARCRPASPGTLAVTRAALSGALDRAVEVAAALEVRGYSAGGRPERSRQRRSRHDLRVTAAALAIAATAVGFRLAGVGDADAYPRIDIALGAPEALLAAALLAATALPFAGRGARLGVAHA
ncbi:MAG TPA: energy-coupling factor transporter transmembrane component T [Thermoleophilaceae bacterium]|nr:energy-coupling factor transporter transmembrane component T [Thermoleophilaceae bacterium]